ncbi:DNA alkylation repair protein [Chitinophaga sp. CF418]|uniref:DNA alkylation repair protein n=1 Tax=Chitinophaga sp. CF418 TaxID=1855287 RepID=UPI0009173261|nr:DNA alkylation repair protein [Chitinophaga sp. CF418]SHM75877.1 3-methyladenine DNA glycosylase AlkD [Chitinophaga sp. CF418]
MDITEIIDLLKEKADTRYHTGMLRFGIDNEKALGVKIPEVRKLAKLMGKEHELALQLWDTRIHEARILASLIADPKLVTPQLIDSWTKDFTSWDVCDQTCGNLFDRTPYAIEKALEFSRHEKEFTKRAGFVLMAELAVHDKKTGDMTFIQFFPIIEREAWDSRNFVKKAVNWALRQIGKRNETLLPLAIQCAERILLQDSKTAKWIAGDALRELTSLKPSRKKGR